jgi:hypothetical protein
VTTRARELSVLSVPKRPPERQQRVATALAVFAGLESLPKATALGSYSYKLDRGHDQRLLEALAPRLLATGQTDGKDIDLDVHAIMHFGDDVALATHYVPRRSQRTESVLTLFAQDGQTRNLVYANADVHKATQADEVMRFVRHVLRTAQLPTAQIPWWNGRTLTFQIGQLTPT